MSPLEKYEHDLHRGALIADDAQRNAVENLERLFDALQGQVKQARKNPFFNFFGKTKPRHPVKGLYLWGGVGRGKTYLMDVFFDALPFDNKMRTHFHRFMRRVHAELTSLKNKENPLEIVAERLASESCVICFDEFFVVDITDAMILANLLEALFARGVSLVATSNIEPQGLYKDGLQRARFLPAISLLMQHTVVINVDGGIDYRLRTLKQAPLYYYPNNTESIAKLSGYFERLIPSSEHVRSNVELLVENRSIRAIKECDDIAWFGFIEICDGPRSQNDYIELAREYHTVFLQDIPVFDGSNDDQARRFIYLIDEFYDRSVKLIMSAACAYHELYRTGRLGFEFQRTVSRIQEMQSEDYLAKAHKA